MRTAVKFKLQFVRGGGEDVSLEFRLAKIRLLQAVEMEILLASTRPQNYLYRAMRLIPRHTKMYTIIRTDNKTIYPCVL